MIDQPSFLDYWASVRNRTRRLIPLIPPDKLEWAPAAGRWSLGDQFRHLAAIERWMYAETLHGRPSRYPGHARNIADGLDAVLLLHDRCHAESMTLFKALTPEQWSGKAITVAGTPITAWKWARAMVEHEAHHRGQVYMTLGMLGIATPPLYGLSEEEVAERSRNATQMGSDTLPREV